MRPRPIGVTLTTSQVIVVPVIPTTPNALAQLINEIATINGTNPCNVAYLGSYPLFCANAINSIIAANPITVSSTTTLNLDASLFPTSQFGITISSFGWRVSVVLSDFRFGFSSRLIRSLHAGSTEK